MLAAIDSMSESGTTCGLSTGGSPVRTIVDPPLNQWEYWSTTWSVAVHPERKMSRGETTANE